MGLGDFIFLVDKLGIFGLILTGLCIVVMLMGSIVDIWQFAYRWRRYRRRAQKSRYDAIKKQVLLDIHNERHAIRG